MSDPCGAHEQEAQRAAQTVMQAREVRMRPITDRSGGGSAPSTIIGALGAGEALNTELADRFGARFGHDFSRVRIHADSAAASAAEALDARALTIGSHIVLGRDVAQAPLTAAGLVTLAHELAHVAQLDRGTSSDGWQGPVMREPKTSPRAAGPKTQGPVPPSPGARTKQDELKHRQWLMDLARDPGDAHSAWKRLGQLERIAVLEKMRQSYGAAFATAFLNIATRGKPEILTSHYGPGLGPAPERLLTRGYRRAGLIRGNTRDQVEVWVHPSGRRVNRDVSVPSPTATAPQEEPEIETEEADSEDAEELDPKAPLTARQIKAKALVFDMRLRLTQLKAFSKMDAIPWKDLRKAYWQYQDASKELATLFGDPQFPDFPDYSEIQDLDPTFQDELSMMDQEITDLWDVFEAKNPGFTSGEVSE